MLIFSSLRGIVESKKDGHAMLILCAVMKHSIKGTFRKSRAASQFKF